MKNASKNSKPRSKKLKKRAQRLAAYSAAAAATVMTTQNRTADAADQNYDILDIRTSGVKAVYLNLPTQSIGYSVADSGWSNAGDGNFLLSRDWFYAPLSDTIGAFANPATCTSEGEPACGTGILPGTLVVPGNLEVYPLPHISGPISAGLSFAARTYNSAASGYGNYAGAYFFKNPAAANAILGLQFKLSGQIHYGWIALSVADNDIDLVFHGFGYNNVAGQPSTPDLNTVDLPGDLNRDGEVDMDDWADFRANFGADLSLQTRDDRYAMGDITHDGLNDIRDFDKFRDAYEAEHGGGSFAAMVAASTVPEPSSILLLAAGAAGIGMWRKRKAS